MQYLATLNEDHFFRINDNGTVLHVLISSPLINTLSLAEYEGGKNERGEVKEISETEFLWEMRRAIAGLGIVPFVNPALNLVYKEHFRSHKDEWTEENDDGHVAGELAQAAMAYICSYEPTRRALEEMQNFGDRPLGAEIIWPWRAEHYKPTPDDPIKQLTKAGNLLASEIDRLVRLQKKAHINHDHSVSQQ